MADEEKRTYPKMSVANWFALRRRFRTTIPTQVTASYLASALNMTADSARNNILPSLRATGLLDQDGKPNDIAKRWRDDSEYPEVCNAIRRNVYPQELLELAPPENADRSTVQKWFAHHTGGGENLVRKLAAFYLMLCEADPNKETDASAATSAKGKGTASKKVKKVVSGQPNTEQEIPESNSGSDRVQLKGASGTPRLHPEFHFNIQVVLPENAPPENYDAIFRSIATHLLGRTEE